MIINILPRYVAYRSGGSTLTRGWYSGLYHNSDDIWRTGYLDIPHGEYKLKFITGDRMKVAVDDVMLLDGMCSNVCKS